MIATGEQHSVREFVELAGAQLGCDDRVARRGRRRRQGVDRASGRVLVKVDPRYFRPTEVETLLGDPAQGPGQARLGAGDRASTELVREMVAGRPRARAARRALHAARLQGLPATMNEPARRGSSSPATAAWSARRIVRRLRAPRLRRTCCCAPAPSSTCATRRRSRRSSRRERPEYVFLAAAKVGGILANNTCPADFIRDNLQIQTNVIERRWRDGVREAAASSARAASTRSSRRSRCARSAC